MHIHSQLLTIVLILSREILCWPATPTYKWRSPWLGPHPHWSNPLSCWSDIQLWQGQETCKSWNRSEHNPTQVPDLHLSVESVLDLVCPGTICILRSSSWSLPMSLYLQQLEECEWFGCAYPPHNPESNNVQPSVLFGQETVEGDKVSYECIPGYSFTETEMSHPIFDLECLANGIWETPFAWPLCSYDERKHFSLKKIVKWYFSFQPKN